MHEQSQKCLLGDYHVNTDSGQINPGEDTWMYQGNRLQDINSKVLQKSHRLQDINSKGLQRSHGLQDINSGGITRKY